MNRITYLAILGGTALVAGVLSLASPKHDAHADATASKAAEPHQQVQLATIASDSFSLVKGHEGFWRVAKTHDGIWWFLSPQNRTEFLNGVTTVQPGLRGRDPRGPDYLSRDWDGHLDDPSLFKWARSTIDRIQITGFKSLGAWSNPVLHRLPVPMTQDLNVWHWVPYDARLFSPDWKSNAEVAIRDQAMPLRDNRELIGYYIDNELNWQDEAVGPRVYFDQLPATDPNRREVVTVIRNTWPTVGDFNRDWNTTFATWSELEQHPKLPMGAKSGYDVLQDRWLTHFSQSYFRITTDLIRKYDPNHLVLGCRYRGSVQAEVARGARGFTDVQSLNYYASDALLDSEIFHTISDESEQPLIISEYSFHSLDGRSGNRNTSHFPAQVPDQQARASGYRGMTSRLARVPFVIGADWFQWMDEPASGRLGDGEDANMGVVDVLDRPYESLAESVRQTTPILNNLHAGSIADRDETVWRPLPAGLHPTQLAGGAGDLLAK
jgi:hypothetical protein